MVVRRTFVSHRTAWDGWRTWSQWKRTNHDRDWTWDVGLVEPGKSLSSPNHPKWQALARWCSTGCAGARRLSRSCDRDRRIHRAERSPGVLLRVTNGNRLVKSRHRSMKQSTINPGRLAQTRLQYSHFFAGDLLPNTGSLQLPITCSPKQIVPVVIVAVVRHGVNTSCFCVTPLGIGWSWADQLASCKWTSRSCRARCFKHLTRARASLSHHQPTVATHVYTYRSPARLIGFHRCLSSRRYDSMLTSPLFASHWRVWVGAGWITWLAMTEQYNSNLPGCLLTEYELRIISSTFKQSLLAVGAAFTKANKTQVTGPLLVICLIRGPQRHWDVVYVVAANSTGWTYAPFDD